MRLSRYFCAGLLLMLSALCALAGAWMAALWLALVASVVVPR